MREGRSRAVLCCVVVGVAYMIIPPLNVLRRRRHSRLVRRSIHCQTIPLV